MYRIFPWPVSYINLNTDFSLSCLMHNRMKAYGKVEEQLLALSVSGQLHFKAVFYG